MRRDNWIPLTVSSALVACLIAAFALGMHTVHTEAVKRGVAEWRVSAHGNTSFAWKEDR